MGAKGSVEAAKINAQNWNNLEVRFGSVFKRVDVVKFRPPTL